MAFIKGYYFLTEDEAIQSQGLCSAYHGMPKSPESVTQYWCDYNYAELNEPKFWYIVYDESLMAVLGEPIEFEVVQPEFNK